MDQSRDRRPGAVLAELERHEIVNGQLVQKASPSFAHGATQGRINVVLGGFWGTGGGADRPGGWWLGTEVEIELAPHEVYLPDIVGWRIDRVPEPPDERPVRIAPDWVCEILSPSTASRDMGPKRQTYHRARVGHYWVVHPVEHLLHVYRWVEEGYLLALAAGSDEVVRAEPFGAIEIVVADIFGLPRA